MKKILCLLLILLLSGCDVVYNLEINDDLFNESTNFQLENSDNVAVNEDMDGSIQYMADDLKSLTDHYLEDEYYAVNYSLKETYNNVRVSDYSFNLDYNFDKNNYPSSNMLSYCFDDVSIINDKGYITFDLKDSSVCFEQDVYERLNSVTINIKSDYEVVSNNADEVNKNIYSWILSKNDSNKEIHIKFKKNNEKKSNKLIIVFPVIFIVGLVIFAAKYIKDKHFSSNEL